MNNMDLYKNNYVKQLMEAYDPFIQAVANHKPDMKPEEASKLAILLHNTQSMLQRTDEATQPADVQNFKKQALALVSAVIPNLIAEELVTVQPLQLKVGQIFFLKYIYGSNKGGVKAGQVAFDRYGRPTNEINYSSEIVEGEEFATGNGTLTKFKANLSYIRVRHINAIDGKAVQVDEQGNVTGTGITGKLNRENGELDITITPAPEDGHVIEVDYEFDLESVLPNTIPEVQLELSETTLKARPRKLKTLYSFDAGQDLMRQQGVDIDESLLEAAVNSIRAEIDAEIINDLWVQAGLTSTWSNKWDKSSGLSKREYNMTFIDEITAAGNAMFEVTRRCQPNFLVVGRLAADALDSIGAPRFQAVANVGGTGAFFAGMLDGRIRVYKNPYFQANQYLLGYRGDTLIDAGYVYAPYLPIMTTNLLMMEDFVGRRGYATSYAKKMLQPQLYIKGTVTTD